MRVFIPSLSKQISKTTGYNTYLRKIELSEIYLKFILFYFFFFNYFSLKLFFFQVNPFGVLCLHFVFFVCLFDSSTALLKNIENGIADHITKLSATEGCNQLFLSGLTDDERYLFYHFSVRRNIAQWHFKHTIES